MIAIRRHVVARFVGATAALGACAAPRASAHHQVVLQSLVIQTAQLAVAPGDTVTWTNRDIVPHTVTATSGGWDSGLIAAQASWSRVITAADTGEYFCRYHPTMRATLARSTTADAPRASN